MTKINKDTPDEDVLIELGRRIARLRLEKNLKQSDLAKQAGIGLRTLQRFENGAVDTRLSSFVRVCQVLGLAGRIDQFIPESVVSPIAMLKREGQKPQRASTRKAGGKRSEKWTWDD